MHSRGRYPVENKNSEVGTYRQVWNGSKTKTSGGLVRSQLKMNKRGRIVSKAKSQAGKKAYRQNGLSQYQY